jgi:phage RecT family recombinase
MSIIATNKDKKKFKEELERLLLNSSSIKDLFIGNTKIDHKQFVSKILGTVMFNPDLQKCDMESIMECCVKSAQLGLPVDASGYAYLIPKKNKCTFQIGSNGWIELVRRNINVKNIIIDAVCTEDEFNYFINGTGRVVYHKPDLDIDRENINNFRGVFAMIIYNNDGIESEWMNKKSIEKIKQSASTQNIWDKWYAEKAKTAVIKRLAKRSCLMNVYEAMEMDDDKLDFEKLIKDVSDVNENKKPKIDLSFTPNNDATEVNEDKNVEIIENQPVVENNVSNMQVETVESTDKIEVQTTQNQILDF